MGLWQRGRGRKSCKFSVLSFGVRKRTTQRLNQKGYQRSDTSDEEAGWWGGEGKKDHTESTEFAEKEKREEKPKTQAHTPCLDCIRAKAPFGNRVCFCLENRSDR